MNSMRAMIEEARAGVDAFETEAIEVIRTLLPGSGKVWKPKHRRPKGVGLYAIWEPGQTKPRWVGYSENLFLRTRQHADAGRYDQATDILTICFVDGTEDHLRDLEAVAIRALQPTLTKHVPFRRGTGPKLQAFLDSLKI